MRIEKLLKNNGLNLRERANVYCGMAFGAVLPVVAMRYGLLNEANPDSVLGETVVWGISTLLASPFSFIGTCVGLSTGYIEARRLRNMRYFRENKK